MKALVGGVDVVYDPVGGDVFDASLRVVNWNARILVVGFAGGTVPQIPANILLVKNVAAMGFYFGSWREKRPAAVAAAFRALDGLVQAGHLEPLVSQPVSTLRNFTPRSNSSSRGAPPARSF